MVIIITSLTTIEVCAYVLYISLHYCITPLFKKSVPDFKSQYQCTMLEVYAFLQDIVVVLMGEDHCQQCVNWFQMVQLE